MFGRESFVMSRPSKTILPSVMSNSRMMHRASVDLPHPDSPTMPSVSPDFTVKLTPSTAFTAPTCFWKMIPRVTGKCFLTSSMTSRSSAMENLLARLGHGRFEQLRGLPILRLLVQMTRLEVRRIVRDRRERGIDLLALVHHVRTAGMEAAAAGRAQKRRRLAGNLHEPLEVGVEPRERAEQAPGVGVVGPAEDLLDRRLFRDLRRVHDEHVVCRLRDDAEVVRDHDDRASEIP